MKIELKNIKHFETLSRETNCFTASIWIDGKKAGVIENDGGGAPDMVDLGDRDQHQKMTAYIKSLPRTKPTELFPQGMPMSENIYFCTLLREALELKQMCGWLRTKVLVKCDDTPAGEWMTYRPNSQQCVDYINKKHKNITHLITRKDEAQKYIADRFAAELVEA